MSLLTGHDGALSGLRIIDFTHMLAGPYCTQMLADQGAEVFKVEPLEGDQARRIYPFHPNDTVRSFSGCFQSVNRNKLGIAIDLKSAEGRDIVRRLVDSADVVVENFRVGVLERLGLSYERLRAGNPRLVYAAVRGFGDPRLGRSPYADWPAYDIVAQAMGGIMGITGPDADTPMKVGPGVGDIMPAAMAAFGILAAVLHARRTGQGQFVDVAMVDSVLALCERIVHQHSYLGKVPHPEGNRHPMICPFGMFRASDGWVTIGCPTQAFWELLCGLIERPDLLADPRFETNELRVAHAKLVCAAIDAYTSGRSKRQLMNLLGGKIPFAPVYTIADIEDDEHFRAREMIIQVEQPGCDAPVKIAGIPVRLSETPGRVTRRAPMLGEDTDAVLADLGFASSLIGDLKRRRVIA